MNHRRLGHDRLSAVTPREVSAWRDHLATAGRDGTAAPMVGVTVNNHLGSWITTQASDAPTKKVTPLPLPTPQVRARAAAQVRTVTNVVDRIETFHELKCHRPDRPARCE
ncbi:hypothetical protein AB0J35_62175 [Nonomuraea angiospora]|uniref:hypothetical protein n=1 Tax=Nonomuraea angiospora TaxID=46172 RepID=UPI00342BB7B3